MKPIVRIILFLLITTLPSCNSEEEKALKLTGEVIDAKTDTIILIKPNQDVRFDSLIKIPVINGKFEYNEMLKNPEVVQLAFAESVKNGAYRPMPLFLENQKIKLTIYPEDEFDRNKIEGGELNYDHEKYRDKFEAKFNTQITPIRDSLSQLFKTNNYFSEKAKKLHEELRISKSQDEKLTIFKELENLEKNEQHLSQAAEKLEERLYPILEKQKQFQQSYIEENPSLISYHLFLDNLIYNKENIDLKQAKKNYQILSKANPGHPYNELSSKLISAIENLKVGKKYIDFSAPDLNGKKIKLSDKIEGKVALLDLWATWCGPCIKKTREMIPIYEEYKDQGFTIVGVAGEFKNTERLERFLEKEKWPWKNLVELDRKNNIWQKYGVDGSGGALFLIDKDGTILSKDPTAKEVTQLLKSHL
ncbi:AhpC/TSA family protein [Gramella sp. GC03-9]|uniref:AhpC/TSA family protein n=1 Tax=Christiangramia oceanisediminis TaxID=2920386 RepID=A0A9X2I2F2_9FLAO|nr:TlpA disulfide reductase family protein [Gramella oceanisediminis]MCP9199984.1 AhpC/TSA family protein [Gramella oceanisediminis]